MPSQNLFVSRAVFTNSIWLVAILVVMLNSCKTDSMTNNHTLKKYLTQHAIDQTELSILIDKSDYTLSVLHNDTAIRTFDVVFGGNPTDDKRMEGDGCTPEGVFQIRNLYPHKKWSKFMWIDYPTADSWKKFEASKAAEEIPTAATIGGEIGIHGVPNGSDALISSKTNWTLGCISLTNADVNDLYEVSFKGMKVEIRK